MIEYIKLFYGTKEINAELKRKRNGVRRRTKNNLMVSRNQ